MENFEKIAVMDDEVQSEVVDSMLTEMKIPHIMKSFHDAALDGLFQGSQGWGQVLAPGDFRGEILAVIADLKSPSSNAVSDPPSAN